MMFSTFAEQDYFIYPRQDACDGVILNANMAAHAPAGLANFVVGKLSDHKYIVDPITHAFQHDPLFIKNDKGEVKSSIRFLADAYGDPVSSRAGKTPLLSAHLNAGMIDGLAARVLEFQRDHLCAYMNSSDAAKYLEEEDIRKPYALIPPYFYMMETEWDDWLAVNLRCVEAAARQRTPTSEPLFAEIVIDRGVLLDPAVRKEVVGGYRGLRKVLAGCIVWVDNFDEQEASVAELSAFKDFCSEMKQFLPEVIDLHGGYFAIMLGGRVGGHALTGVTHGPEFGEFRSVIPVGGGIPIAKYYIPRLHARVRYREAADIFEAAGWLTSSRQFHEEVCDCEECRATLSGNIARFTLFGEGEVKNVRRGRGMVRIEFPSTATKLRCLRHYLQRKHREYLMVQNAEPGQTLEELKNSISLYRPLVGSDGIAHLVRWQKVLKNSG
jgi:hypothetical protein